MIRQIINLHLSLNRFCLDSVPLPNKEKVNLDLKNIVIKKKCSNSNNYFRKNQPV